MAAGSELAYKGILCTPEYNLGGKALVSCDGKRHRILLLNADGQQDPLSICVSIDVKNKVPAIKDSTHRLLAKCDWGSYSGGGSVIFDLRHGARMTLDASHISLDVFADGVDAQGEWLVVSSVTYGSFSGPSSLTFTEQPVLVNAGATSAKFAVPSYARRVAIYADLSGVTRDALCYTSNDPAATPIMRIPCTNGMEPVPLPNGIEFIEVVNTSVALNGTFTLFYELVI